MATRSSVSTSNNNNKNSRSNKSDNNNNNKKGNEVPNSSSTSASISNKGSSPSVPNVSGTVLNTRSRHRKISVKQKLKIFLPNDLKHLDQNELQQRDVVDHIETGVEKSEEKEVHLHRILTQQRTLDSHDTTTDEDKTKNNEKAYIPTPATQQNWDEFNSFYHGKFVQSKNFIKFSATVEDCCGISYNMDETDDEFLTNYNKKITDSNSDSVSDKQPLNEDEFELLCAAFEHAIKERQPFLSMDPERILSFTELKPTLLKLDFANLGLKLKLAHELNYSTDEKFLTQYDPTQLDTVRPIYQLIEVYGNDIYDHWKLRKIDANGSEIFPQLKFEKPGEREEVDPYVCFRRREVRHPRKTRRIDVINSHKLKLLYRELQHAKNMALLVAKRELTAYKLLQSEFKILDDRLKIITLKRSLNISADDDDLINHKRRRPNILTVERRQQIEKEEAEAILRKNSELASVQSTTAKSNNINEPLSVSINKNADDKNNKNNKIASSANLTETDATTTTTTTKRNGRTKLTKKQLEQLAKYGEKLTKQQLEQLQIQSSDSRSEMKSKAQSSSQKKVDQKSQQQQQQPSIATHVYVKLPSCKIPDIALDDVESILNQKEKSARKFVHDRMEKRKIEDGNQYFNLTDDPFNPVFDIALPKHLDSTTAPFASVASSKFSIDNSYYVPNFNNYLQGNAKDIKVFNKDGERIINDNLSYIKKVEIYNPFQAHNEIHSREYPVKFRRRYGRNNIQYIDRKPNYNSIDVNKDEKNEMMNQFFDFDAIEEETSKVDEYIDVYESKADELTRLYEKWKYDSPLNEFGNKFSESPSHLNQISNQTQVIRFGTMLGTKSYEQLRKATLKFRREYINKLKQHQKVIQKHQLQKIQTLSKNVSNLNQKSNSNSRQTSKTPRIKNESKAPSISQ